MFFCRIIMDGYTLSEHPSAEDQTQPAPTRRAHPRPEYADAKRDLDTWTLASSTRAKKEIEDLLDDCENKGFRIAICGLLHTKKGWRLDAQKPTTTTFGPEHFVVTLQNEPASEVSLTRKAFKPARSQRIQAGGMKLEVLIKTFVPSSRYTTEGPATNRGVVEILRRCLRDQVSCAVMCGDAPGEWLLSKEPMRTPV